MNGVLSSFIVYPVSLIIHLLVVDDGQIFSQFEQLERKIGVLRDLYGDAKRRIEQLEEEKADLNKQVKAEQDRVRNLEKKQGELEKKQAKSKDFGKLVQDNLSGTDTNAELKQQLDAYIREIERCITYLSSLS